MGAVVRNSVVSTAQHSKADIAAFRLRNIIVAMIEEPRFMENRNDIRTNDIKGKQANDQKISNQRPPSQITTTRDNLEKIYKI